MKALIKAGVSVEIVMPSNQKKAGGEYEGVPYSFVKIVNKSNRFSNRKLINEYAKLFHSLANRCDILYTSEDRCFSLLKLTNAVQSAGKKIVIELNENPYSIFSSRIDTRWTLNIRRFFFLQFVLPKVDGVISISQNLYHVASTYKSKKAEVVKIPILTGNKSLPKNSSYKGTPFILHAGALSEQKDGIKAMLIAFQIAHKRLNGRLKFIFTQKRGFPSLMKWVDNFIKQNQLEHSIEFRGIIPKEELDELYANCSLAIVNKPSNPQNDYNFPTKLTELLPRGIPVIVSSTGELKNYFIDNENACLVEGNNAEQIAEKIVLIIKNPEVAKSIGENARITAEKYFYYENHADQLTEFFKKVIKN